jgi:uncharacterized protein
LIQKLLLSVVLCILSTSAFSIDKISKPSGPVADYAGIIDASDERQIYQIAERLWNKVKIGIVVVTFPDICDESVEDVASKLYEKWGIGSSKTDEGILLLVSLNPRKIKIETGYGSESYLNDAKVGRIIDSYALPYLSIGRYSEGIRSTVMAVAAIIGNNNTDLSTDESQTEKSTIRIPSIFKMIIGILAVLFLLGTPMGRMILVAMILSGGRGRYNNGGFGGGFGGGGFGGGFGGGGSGGGGASRNF